MTLDHPRTNSEWKALRAILKPLEPFDELYQTFYQAARDRIQAMSNAELDAVVRAIRSLSSTNCGWTMYAAGEAIARDAENLAEKRIREIGAEVLETLEAVQSAR